MKIVAICNQKGGVGKTSTSVSLAAFLGILGRKTLLVDLDPQGNSTSGLGIEKNSVAKSTYNVLIEQDSAKDAVIPTQIENLSVLPSNINLTGAEIELVSIMGRESRLKKSLSEIKDQFEFAIIDCPPSLGMLTVNAMTAANSVIVPVQCEYYALEGIGQLVKTIDLVRDNLNSQLHIEGILMTMADYRTKLTDQVIEEVKKFFGERVYSTIIPRSVKMSEAPGFGKPIMLYDRNSFVSKKYEQFAQEFLDKNSVSHSKQTT